jgi:hypothetical protein
MGVEMFYTPVPQRHYQPWIDPIWPVCIPGRSGWQVLPTRDPPHQLCVAFDLLENLFQTHHRDYSSKHSSGQTRQEHHSDF